MHNIQTKHKFIELRARDMSFRRIGEELGIDKNTAMRWNHEFAARIHNLKQIELEHLQEQLPGLSCRAPSSPRTRLSSLQ